MKDRKEREAISWSTFFWCTIFIVVFTGFTFSTFRLFHDTFHFHDFHPVLVSRWKTPAMEAIYSRSPLVVSVRESVAFPDQVLFFVKYARPGGVFSKEDFGCVAWINSSETKSPAMVSNGQDGSGEQIVRCPAGTVTLVLKSDVKLHSGYTHTWNSVAYDAVIDRDNTTIVFVKGLNLKPERCSDASRFECVYGWDFSRAKFVLRSNVVSVAQEIIRCKTPLSVLSASRPSDLKVSVRVKGGSGVIPSIARPITRVQSGPDSGKEFEMCVCTMVRNQAQSIPEWVIYHARIGVRRWFIYDNNSDDDLDVILDSLMMQNYNITRHLWPWIKTQEAGFAHCAIRARSVCEWVGFIDVDEFFHLPSGLVLHSVLRNNSRSGRVGEIRTSCHSFGPSGLHRAPAEGVTVGYTCRMSVPERHKSIVRPDALNSSLINVVHHFHLQSGFRSVHMDRAVMVINHYKYQVWDVFKEKFYRRVATYVADWQDEENVGSKDRAPGLGTRPVEPPDWSSRFCEVMDTGLKDRVLDMFLDPKTRMLPWQVEAKHS